MLLLPRVFPGCCDSVQIHVRLSRRLSTAADFKSTLRTSLPGKRPHTPVENELSTLSPLCSPFSPLPIHSRPERAHQLTQFSFPLLHSLTRVDGGWLAVCSTWVAATTEGLLVYSLDEETMFDPTDLGEDVTPAAAAAALKQGAHGEPPFEC